MAAVGLHDRELWLDQFEPARNNDPGLRRYAAQQAEGIIEAVSLLDELHAVKPLMAALRGPDHQAPVV